jgi:hypothetical protein
MPENMEEMMSHKEKMILFFWSFVAECFAFFAAEGYIPMLVFGIAMLTFMTLELIDEAIRVLRSINER